MKREEVLHMELWKREFVCGLDRQGLIVLIAGRGGLRG